MKNTPIHDDFNKSLLPLIPEDASRVIEVGCSSGALARAFLAINRQCEYIGIEVDSDCAEVAKKNCTKVLVGNIEDMEERVFRTLCPSDCWIFGDVLEHLYDPWSVLRRVKSSLRQGGSVVACIPNAQHWSVQARLNVGSFHYEDSGLLDRTHIRWFTRVTMLELFKSSGFEIVAGGGRIFDEPQRASALEGVRALAKALGADPDMAANDATPLQWVVRAVSV